MNNKKSGNKDETSNSAFADVKSWVFLSHSNLDYERVTFVRNALERNNKRPIMFFLKCLEEENELNDLLKREIDARDQFILCDSENARRSEWVQEEVRYIKSKGRVYQTINLDDPDETIERAVAHFINRSKVCVSYSRCDVSLARMVTELLRQFEYDVWFDIDGIKSGTDFVSEITKAMDDAGRSGYQLILLSRSMMNSAWCLKEISYFISKYGNKWVIPVNIDGTPLSDELASLLSDNLICDVSTCDSPGEKAKKIVEFLVRRDQALSE